MSTREKRRRLRSLTAEMEARRGCADCEARATCSRCLAPDFMTEEAYCRMMKRGPAVAEYARLLDVVFAGARTAESADPEREVLFKPFAPGSRRTRFIYRGPDGDSDSSVEPGAVLMLYRGNPIFYLPASRELVDVSVPLAEVAEAIHAGADARTMQSYFAEKYELAADEAPAKVEEAISMLAEYGILESSAVSPRTRPGEPPPEPEIEMSVH